MLKLFPSQYYFDRETEERYMEWIFKKVRIFVAIVGLLVLSIIAAITLANIYVKGFTLVQNTVLYIRLAVIPICIITVSTFLWLPAKAAQRIILLANLILTVLTGLDTYYWVGTVGHFSPEAQMITMYMFMIIPFLNVEHKILTGFLVLLGLLICWLLHGGTVIWAFFYAGMMYGTNIVIYYIFDILLRTQFKTICAEQSRSYTDMLTGVYNKNALYTFFPKDVRSLQPAEKMLVAVLDLDCFKPYNDTYGHLAGDRVLKQISQALLSFGFDKVYRFGGEEFIITQRSPLNATASLPNICGVLENLNIAHSSSTVSNYVTASIGAVTVISNGRSSEVMDDEALINCIIQRADQKLYQAKSSGRNQAIIDVENLQL